MPFNDRVLTFRLATPFPHISYDLPHRPLQTAVDASSMRKRRLAMSHRREATVRCVDNVLAGDITANV